MNLPEKENLIKSWPDPWPEILSLKQKSRDSLLQLAEDDEDKTRIHRNYEASVSRMLLKPPTTR
jgi:hypothetical protein